MKLFSAYEDFVKSTVSKIPNALDRLRFIAEMRREGEYDHWGLTKTYGREAAQRGMSEAHADSFEEVLTTPVPKLENSAKAVPEQVAENISQMLPPDLRGGTPKHLSWVLKVVYLLHRSRPDSNQDA